MTGLIGLLALFLAVQIGAAALASSPPGTGHWPPGCLVSNILIGIGVFLILAWWMG